MLVVLFVYLCRSCSPTPVLLCSSSLPLFHTTGT